VFHLLRNKRPDAWSDGRVAVRRKEPLDYLVKVQRQWERRITKSLNSMSSELGLCLAKPRCQETQDELNAKWQELSSLDVDLTLFRPVYAPKDFLEILTQVRFVLAMVYFFNPTTRMKVNSPNLVTLAGTEPVAIDETTASSPSSPLTAPAVVSSAGLVRIPLAVPSLNDLRKKFSELAAGDPHLGSVSAVAGTDTGADAFEAERYALGQRVILANHAPLSQEFLKRGAPHSLRGRLWAQVTNAVSMQKVFLS